MDIFEKIEEKSFFIMEFFNRAEEKTTNKKLQNRLFHSEVIPLDILSKILSKYVVISRKELQEIYNDDINYISKKDLIKKMLEGKGKNED